MATENSRRCLNSTSWCADEIGRFPQAIYRISASSISAQSWYREKSVDKEDDEPADPHQEKNEAVADESSSLSEFCI
jgi:hypothetical protein